MSAHISGFFIFDVCEDEYSVNMLSISESLELWLPCSVSQKRTISMLWEAFALYILLQEGVEGTVSPHAVSSHLQAALAE